MNDERGLAVERTQLAWQRYAFGVAIVAALALRAGLVGRHAVGGFAVAFALAVFAAALQLEGPRLEPGRAVRLALGASLTAAGGALLLALL